MVLSMTTTHLNQHVAPAHDTALPERVFVGLCATEGGFTAMTSPEHDAIAVFSDRDLLLAFAAGSRSPVQVVAMSGSRFSESTVVLDPTQRSVSESLLVSA
jgi:hypothetical protein